MEGIFLFIFLTHTKKCSVKVPFQVASCFPLDDPIKQLPLTQAIIYNSRKYDNHTEVHDLGFLKTKLVNSLRANLPFVHRLDPAGS